MTNSTMSPEQFVGLCKQGEKIVLVDVPTPVEIREVHVEIARNVPLGRLDPVALIQARNGSANDPLYLICRSGNRGQQACEKFVKAEFSNVVNIEGGTIACVEAGLPVVRGKNVMSLEPQVRGTAGSGLHQRSWNQRQSAISSVQLDLRRSFLLGGNRDCICTLRQGRSV